MRSSPGPDPRLSFSLTDEAVEDGQRKGGGPIASPCLDPSPTHMLLPHTPLLSCFHHLLDFRLHRSAHFCKNRFKQLATICQFITSQTRNIKMGEANINPLSMRMSLFQRKRTGRVSPAQEPLHPGKTPLPQKPILL